MIVLDTNVVSEPIKSNGDRRVEAWLDEQLAETVLRLWRLAYEPHAARRRMEDI